MTKFKRISAMMFAFAMLMQMVVVANAQYSNKDIEIYAKIRKEAMDNSQIMNTLHKFSDVYGPRLTGSPNLEEAGKWAMRQMDQWGFDKTEMEPFDWGSPGWTNDRATGHIITPVKDQLTFEVLAWTPGTNGTVTGGAVAMNIPTKQIGDNPRCVRGPSQAELTAYFNSVKSKVAGGMVLFSPPAKPGVNFDPPNKRLTEEEINARRSGRRNRNRPSRPTCPKPDVTPLNGRQVFTQINQFLSENKPAVRINDARFEHGRIRAFGNRRANPETSLPTVVMRNEDYGRIWRLLENGNDVKLEFNIANTFYPEGKTVYNTIGEIRGTDKADEVIMLGGHLDSWHAATGATDNGIGCATMMEAARILNAIGVKSRRTIRVALWTAEEQGLIGSQEYVKKHFGTAENPKPAYNKFGGYFNVDSGTGRIRGMSVFGPQEAATIVGIAASPMAGNGFVGSSATASRRLGGSDHTSFNQAGLPGIGTLLDPIEYFSKTWHTNFDTYERIVEDDVKSNAAMIAASVYYLANRDELLPRFSKSKMPKAPAPRRR